MSFLYRMLRLHSLRRWAALCLLIPLALLVPLNLYWSYQRAVATVNLAYDRSLTASVSAISEHSYSSNGKIRVDIPNAAFDFFDSGMQERIYYAVASTDRHYITGYADLPLPDTLPEDGKVHIESRLYQGIPIRIATLRKRLYDAQLTPDDSILISFAETMESRNDLVRMLFYTGLNHQLLLVALAVLSLFFALSIAFRPLIKLRDAVRSRSEEDLTPIPLENVASEVRPLIEAINHHMDRLELMLQARKRFLSDAAHQIRTPLTILRTQVEYGLRQHDPKEMQRCLERLLRSITSTQRMANQMLTLSHAEAANGLIQKFAPVDLAVLAREVALTLSPLAMQKEIDLSFDSSGKTVVLGNLSMLQEMISNLLDNAIRYTPQGGRVNVTVQGSETTTVIGDAILDVLLIVSDNGPGIPVTEQQNVFKRFYRSLWQSDSDGSGLGLAIVQEICNAHGGKVSLHNNENHEGLRVEVRLQSLPTTESG